MDIAATVIAIIFIAGLLALGIFYLWKKRNIDIPSYKLNDPFAPAKEEKAAARKAEKEEKKSGKSDKTDKTAKKAEKKAKK